MKLCLSLLAAVLSVGTATAASSRKRAVGGVHMCVGPNSTGLCEYRVWEMEVCHDLPPAFRQNVNTFLVDGENFYCFPHVGACGGICMSPTGCSFGMVTWQHPNRYNLSAIGWSRLLKSFDCFFFPNTTEREE